MRPAALVGGAALVVVGGLGGYLLAGREKPAGFDLPALYRAAEPAVVTVRTDLARLDALEARGVGTAFHIGDGLYVTSAHVVEGGNKVFVEPLGPGGRLEATRAEVIGADRPSDIALLRAKPAVARLEWATDPPTVGRTVFAIGNPFGEAPGSLSLGVLSGVNRLVLGPTGTLVGLVQTDAALNQGNSGGPLLDEAGRVVGVNAAILSTSGANAGVGFAVPTATARRVVDLLKRGKVIHPSLGVTGDPDGPPVLERVLPGAGQRAGLRSGDAVERAAGYEVTSFEELSAVVAAQEPGSRISLVVRRGGRLSTLDVALD